MIHLALGPRRRNRMSAGGKCCAGGQPTGNVRRERVDTVTACIVYAVGSVLVQVHATRRLGDADATWSKAVTSFPWVLALATPEGLSQSSVDHAGCLRHRPCAHGVRSAPQHHAVQHQRRGAGRTQPRLGCPAVPVSPTVMDTGSTCPPVCRRTVHPDCPSSARDAAVLPIRSLQEPRPQLLRNRGSRNSRNSGCCGDRLETATEGWRPLRSPGEGARHSGGIPLPRPRCLAARAHGRRARARHDGHARDDARARRTQRDGRGCVARAGEQRAVGPADRPTNATHLMHNAVSGPEPAPS